MAAFLALAGAFAGAFFAGAFLGAGAFFGAAAFLGALQIPKKWLGHGCDDNGGKRKTDAFFLGSSTSKALDVSESVSDSSNYKRPQVVRVFVNKRGFVTKT